jgi:adenine-specific DNA-methyltransferase
MRYLRWLVFGSSTYRFVVDTGYCVTLDKVPVKLYPAVIANTTQMEEWKRLFAIQDIEGDLHTPKYTDPVTMEFLKANPFLVLDTAFFDREFTEKLLASFDNLDEVTDGLLVHSENFQAINLLLGRFNGQVKCTYIDPPYNTDASPIMYKNGYKESSWMSMMHDRIALSSTVLQENGTLAVAIDDTQQRELSFILSEIFENRLLGTFCVRSNPSGRPMQTGYSVAHEYVMFAGKSTQAVIGRMPATAEQMSRFSECDDIGRFEWRNLRREGSNSDRNARRFLYYPIYHQ